MCGITGYRSTIGQIERLRKATSALAHRGPDCQGTHVTMVDETHYGLGHTRLSIIDLTTNGDQPMRSMCGRYTIVFNGEIYNYKELRNRLEGPAQASASDTRVLIELFSEYGTEIFQALRGIFAFSVLDEVTGDLYLVRDHIGVKPVYYLTLQDDFFFSSEIQSIRSFYNGSFSIDKTALYEFLTYGYIFEPSTGINEIKKVPPGCYLVVNKCGVSTERYFDLKKTSNIFQEDVNELVKTSIAAQSESDAPIGIFFSGGVDSTVITTNVSLENLYVETSAHHTSDRHSDQNYVEAIAEHLDLSIGIYNFHHASLEGAALLERVIEIPAGIEELIGDYTYAASSQISAIASQKGYKVMLSGMGADEIFFGYNRHQLIGRGSIFRLAMSAALKVLKPVLALIPARNNRYGRLVSAFEEIDFPLRYGRLVGYLSRAEIEGILGDSEAKALERDFMKKMSGQLGIDALASETQQAFLLDFYGCLSHNLMVADKSSMQFGVELRVPLIDVDLVKNQFNLASNLRRKSLFVGKKQLKNLLIGLIPERLINRPKRGFNPPLAELVNKIGEPSLMKFIRDSHTIVPAEFFSTLISEHFSNKKDNSYKIWLVLYLEAWCRLYNIKTN